MKKAFLLVTILFVSVISTACINNFAVQELNNKAKTYLENGDFESAIGRLKSSIDLDSTIFETHYNLGIAYTQAEQYPEAVETFTSAIKLKPDFADAYYSLAVAQENFAKGIIDGTIKDKKDSELEDDADKSEMKAKDEDLDEEKKPVKLTKEDKAKIVELFNDSITSYTSYLEKGQEIKDKEEVDQKIEYLKTLIGKYSDEKTKSAE